MKIFQFFPIYLYTSLTEPVGGIPKRAPDAYNGMNPWADKYVHAAHRNEFSYFANCSQYLQHILNSGEALTQNIQTTGVNADESI